MSGIHSTHNTYAAKQMPQNVGLLATELWSAQTVHPPQKRLLGDRLARDARMLGQAAHQTRDWPVTL